MFKPKVLELANKISRKKMGKKNAITEKHAEYRILAPVVTEEMAEVALCLDLRNPQTADVIAQRCGKDLDLTKTLLWELAMAGVCFVNTVDGEDVYWHDTWVPGVMEMMTNNKENVKKHPEIAQAFNDYGIEKGPATAGNFPVGKGLMRVIPIEQAIDGETRKASYEEVSKYLNENEIFSVSDCSCRTARESMGEGCGHLKEEMCIQLGHAAEYYIKTGRGRQITREEAFEIIKQAEEDGLVHQIPNVDGSGKTHAICNCCGCSCFALRTAEMFVNPDMVRSNYVSQVDKEVCVGCGECVDACPVNALKLGDKVCGIERVIKRDVLPSNTEWTEEHWNVDYRYNRTETLDTGTSPCKTECPAHISIPGYIKLASQGRYQEALKMIKKDNPLPAVCGRICPKLCEDACTRGELDEGVAIDDIKKFIAEQDLNSENRYIPKIKKKHNIKIAIIGAGPSGLSAAYYLQTQGYDVTVFEKQNVLGGMLTLGIPSFRLQKDVIHAEIDILKTIGVEFKTGIEVGKDITIQTLREQNYKAFYIAIGAQKGRTLNINGEEHEQVISGVDFLRNVNLKETTKVKGKIIVIGGGNVAIDVARTAKRLDTASVHLFALETRDKMPALNEEIEEAMHEKIQFHNGYGPKEIVVEDGKLKGVIFHKCIQVFDNSGKFNPQFDKNDTHFEACDTVILSVGQTIDLNTILNGTNIKINANNTIQVDPVTLQSYEEDIFAGGDVVTGPKYAIDAIAHGKEAAISIHRFVHVGQSLTIGRNTKTFVALNKEDVNYDSYDYIPRQKAKPKPITEAFDDPRGTLSESQIKEETSRCLTCGTTVVDEFLCVGCGVCTTKCEFDAISLIRKYDEEGVSFEDLKPVIIKHALKRKARLFFNKIKRAIGLR